MEPNGAKWLLNKLASINTNTEMGIVNTIPERMRIKSFLLQIWNFYGMGRGGGLVGGWGANGVIIGNIRGCGEYWENPLESNYLGGGGQKEKPTVGEVGGVHTFRNHTFSLMSITIY